MRTKATILIITILTTSAPATEITTTSRFKIVVAPDFRHPTVNTTYLIDQNTGDTWYAASMPVHTSGTNTTTHLVWVQAFVIKQDSPITTPAITTMKGWQNANTNAPPTNPSAAQ